MFTIQQVAERLEVDKKTLIRWDFEGKWRPIRETRTNVRLYDEFEVMNHVKWFKLRRKHKAHLRLLAPLNKERNKFITTDPLQPGQAATVFPIKEMKKAFDAVAQWEKEEKLIVDEYSTMPPGFMHKVDPFY